MRTIMVGGIPCPIKATTGTISASTDRLKWALLDAETAAEKRIETLHLSADDATKIVDEERRKAQLAYMSDASNSLHTISDMLNAAVDYERIINGHNIKERCPYYPVTPDKLGIVMTLQELNDPDTSQTIAEEIAEATGSKNLTAGRLMQVAQMM